MQNETIQRLPQAALVPRAVNRTDLDLDPEFLADIKANGVLTPLLVRPHPTKPDTFEIIKGHRRWTANGQAGAPEIPAIVRPLTDRQAAEEQLRDCVLARNLRPLDEARLYQESLKSGAYGTGTPAVVALAAAIGIAPSTIYASLRRLKLPKAAQNALAAGAIEASVADLVATIPDEKDQAKFLKDVLGNTEWDPEEKKQVRTPMSFRDAKDLIGRGYRLSLKGAPFELSDEALGTAPSCEQCPRRTGNIAGLPSGSSPNVCTDPKCYKGKVGAFHGRQLAELKAKGFEVLPEKQAKAVFDRYQGAVVQGNSGYVDSAARLPYEYQKNWQDERTWGQALKTLDPKPVIAVDATGTPHKLYRLKGLNLAKAGVKKVKSSGSLIRKESPEQKAKRLRQEQIAKAETTAIVEACIAVVENPKMSDRQQALLWDFMIARILCDADPQLVADRRQIAVGNFDRCAGRDPESDLILHVCRAHAVELSLTNYGVGDYAEEQIMALARLLKVDTKAIAKTVEKEFAAPLPKPGKAPAKKGKAKKGKGK